MSCLFVWTPSLQLSSNWIENTWIPPLFILQAEAIILLAWQLENFVLAPNKYPKPYADHDICYSRLG